MTDHSFEFTHAITRRPVRSVKEPRGKRLGQIAKVGY